MSSDVPSNGMRALWQEQPLENSRMSLEDIRRRAQQLDSRIRRRNLRQILIAMVVVAICAWGVWAFPNNLTRVGSGVEIVAMFLVVYHLQTHSVSRTVPEDLTWTSGRAFLRRSLEVRRDYVRDVWSWQILPPVPGILLMLLGFLIHDPHRPTAAWILVVVIGQLAFARRRFQRSAERYQQEIDALDAMERR